MNLLFKIARPQSRLPALLCLSTLLLAEPARSQENKIIPQPYPDSRYESLGKKSPFALSSAAQETTAGFAENLALAGVIKIDGEYFVAIVDKTTQKRELISSKPNKQGLQLGNVDFSDQLEKVAVTLKKNGESSTLHYDMSFIKASTAKGGQPNQPTVPGAPMNAGGPQNSLPSGPPPVAAPIRRRFVPSSPSPSPAPQPTGAIPITKRNP